MLTPRACLLVPPHFLAQYSVEQRELIVQHELAHLHRGDALWILLAECALAVLWFHPLMWFALPRFRLDQELACDEHVLRASPEQTQRYAKTLFHSIAADAQPVLLNWLAEPQLKERLLMIGRPPLSALRRCIGLCRRRGIAG